MAFITPDFTAAAVALSALSIVSLVALRGWRDWIQLKREELAAGPPAAGKSTLMGAPAPDLAEYRQIDAADFQTLLPRSAVLDGSTHTLPPAPPRGTQQKH